ncbi:MAG: lysine--tRNA ligase [Candidatus Nanohalarchaeota archaeon]|nr:MAG: lysine--tRNA ligase [Candidatus Nanohaloarchaeota archaeon]
MAEKICMQSLHWADQYAKKIIEKNPGKTYIIESGITPSGIVHIGNFREVMTQYLVYRALLDRGEKAEFIYMWDDYDRFRKVPKRIDKSYEQYIGMPVSMVPDPWNCHESYADHFKEKLMEELNILNIHPKYLSATELYKKCTFAKNINTALKNTEKIKQILNKFRKENLGEKWLPAIVVCSKCHKETENLEYVKDYTVKYRCSCGNEETIDFRKKGNVKLRWRTDWASRWAHYGVDFESSGKDHKSQGGSWDTSTLICEEVFQKPVPIGPMYEFINTKGNAGKMSSSLGNTTTVSDLLKIYTPEVIKSIYTAKLNKPIDIAFDNDIFNIYNYYDETEEAYFGKKTLENKKKEIQLKRLYELSQIDEINEQIPKKISFREAVNIVLYVAEEKRKEYAFSFAEGEGDKLIDSDKKIIENRLNCAKYWLDNYADENIKIALLEAPDKKLDVGDFKKSIKNICDNLTGCQSQKDIEQLIYNSAKDFNKQPRDMFRILYLALIGKERGPRLGGFIEMIGKEKIKRLLEGYIK